MIPNLAPVPRYGVNRPGQPEQGRLHREQAGLRVDRLVQQPAVPGRPEEDPLFQCLRGELEDRLSEAIANLPDRERLVMTLYYFEEMTMREIGLALGVVESRVSQVHASAVVHMRVALKDLVARGALERTAARKPIDRARR